MSSPAPSRANRPGDAPPAFALVEGVDYGAEIVLESGEVIVIDLLEETAPQNVNNFVFLVNQRFYNDLTFHEVLPGLSVRAGDPTAGDPVRRLAYRRRLRACG